MSEVLESRERTIREKEKHMEALLADAQAKHRAACDLEKERANMLTLKARLLEEQDQFHQTVKMFEAQKVQFEQDKSKYEEKTRVRELELGQKETDLKNKQLEYEKSKRNLEIAWEKHTQKVALLKQLLSE